MSCALIFIAALYGFDFMADIDINSLSMGPIFGVWIGPTFGVPKWTTPHVMCTDFLSGIIWVRFHGRYWYQSFIDVSNICGVDRTDPWGSEIDHPPLGRSYLVIVLSYDMSRTLILLTGLYGCDSMTDIDINPSSMGPMFGMWIGPTLGVPKWTTPHWAAAIW